MASDKFSPKANNSKPDLTEIISLRKKLKDALTPDRYEHSLGVSYTSISLAMRYGADLRKAELAGLVHDCAKQFGKNELIRACERDHVRLPEDALKAPQVLHSIYGAYYARTALGIEDPEVLSAVYYHTLGRPEMSLLEEIIFTADYIEPRRYKAAHLPEIRKLAFTDLDHAVYEILKDTIAYLEADGSYICKDTFETYRYYKDLVEDSEETKSIK